MERIFGHEVHFKYGATVMLAVENVKKHLFRFTLSDILTLALMSTLTPQNEGHSRYISLPSPLQVFLIMIFSYLGQVNAIEGYLINISKLLYNIFTYVL